MKLVEDGGDMTFALEQFGDLAAIATVADVVSLTGEIAFWYSKGCGCSPIRNARACWHCWN
ncbi:MAG: hypothetical protein ACLSTI_06790 [Ruminococcus sp.]